MLGLRYILILGLSVTSALSLPPTVYNVLGQGQNLTVPLLAQTVSAPDLNFQDIICGSPSSSPRLQWSENIACIIRHMQRRHTGAKLGIVIGFPQGTLPGSRLPADFTDIRLFFIDESAGRQEQHRLFRFIESTPIWGHWKGNLDDKIALQPDKPYLPLDWSVDTLDLAAAAGILEAADERYRVPWESVTITKFRSERSPTQAIYWFSLLGVGRVGVGTQDREIYLQSRIEAKF